MDYLQLTQKYDRGKRIIFVALGLITLLTYTLNSITYLHIHPIQEIVLEICGIAVCSSILLSYMRWGKGYPVLFAILTYAIITSIFVTHVYFMNFTDMASHPKPQMLLRNISFIFVYMAFVGFISGRRHIFVTAGIVLFMIGFYAFYVRDPFYRNNFHIFTLVILGYSAALHFFVKATHGFVESLEQVTRESELLKHVAEERSRELEEVNTMLEERQEEINLQKDEIQAQYESLEETNRLLQESQTRVMEQNRELDQHRNKLESLVEERTRELEKALMKAKESERLKSSFLANMSHEIRTPMNAIVGFASLLNDEHLKEEHKEYIKIIESNGMMLMALINDILDLSSIESQHFSLKPRRQNLVDTLNRLHEMFAREAAQKNLSLRLNTASLPDEFEMVFDETRLKQVFSNLLSNACKFTNSGFVEFGVRGISHVVTFYVKDTGIGISREAGNSIFNRFYKIEENQGQIFRGTGLGLAICKSIVELWDGSICYESEPGKGTTFFFSYPMLPSDEMKSRQPADRNPDTVDLHGKKLLIVEDEKSNYKLLETYLKGTNASICWAKNGVEALQMVNETPFDLVLMDIKMPYMDGIEASRLIKELNPHLPIVAQTAFAFSAEVEEIRRSGIDGYITKPINRSELIDLVVKLINHARTT